MNTESKGLTLAQKHPELVKFSPVCPDCKFFHVHYTSRALMFSAVLTGNPDRFQTALEYYISHADTLVVEKGDDAYKFDRVMQIMAMDIEVGRRFKSRGVECLMDLIELEQRRELEYSSRLFTLNHPSP